jgi:phospholipid/cholesterol/gamma-HCH transport system substrate-binding protein
VLIIGGLVYVAGFRGKEEVEYVVIFEGDVLGLSEGSQVYYKGFPVGRVDSIRLGPQQKVQANILVEREKVRLYKGVTASLDILSFATGQMIITLKGGEPSEGPLQEGTIIEAEPSLVESFSQSASELVDSFTAISDKISKGLEGMPEGELAAVVSETKETIKHLRDLAGELKTFFLDFRGDFESLTADLKVTISSVNEGVGDVRKLATESTGMVNAAQKTIETVHEKIEPVDLAALAETLQKDIDQVAQRLDAVGANLQEVSESVNYQTGEVSYMLTRTIEEFKATLESVRDLADYLRNNPSSVVRGKALSPEP